MAAAQKKNTYTAAEVAELQTTIRQQQAQIDDLLALLEAYRNGAVTEAHED